MKTHLFQMMLAAALTAGSVSSAVAQTNRPAPAPPPPLKVKVGDPAPLIESKDQDGKTWKLADRIGKKAVLLYFYPKDDTRGCTAQACGLRDNMSELQKQDVEVVGVSFDSAESHLSFISKYSLNFPLLADTDGKVADAFGVRMPDRAMARRVSFLINKEGRIVHITDTGKAETHVAEMKEAAGKLKG